VDTATTRTFLEAAAPRVQCPDHGVLVAHVPWARPGAKCTYVLEDTCAWLAKNMALTAVTVFLRRSWRTVFPTSVVGASGGRPGSNPPESI